MLISNERYTMKDGRWIKGFEKAAEYCGVSAKTVSRWAKSGDLKVNRMSKKMVLLEKSEIDACIQRKGDAN